MSVDKAFRDMIRNEIEVQLKPLRDVVSRLESGTADLDALRNVAERLAPLAEVVGPLFGAQVAAAKPGRKAVGRPPAAARGAVSAAASVSAGGKRRGRKPAAADGSRECAIVDCGKPSRTKGYCAAHYQKLRMLEKTNRRPSAWVDYAPANSVEDIKLPRGRAASKALAAAAQAANG
ncbi:cell wall protein [Myxococcus sp. CA051A]|uniref:Cell wall protein n=1 Tax=Myxococcus llanfairpwllgwyngyllgogerychwyrndrobwllllantysiliogogogochensis TaxID=2590453 RepID=A0A540WMN0_9BACT|nr:MULTISPECIES: cell wall protein [Myxococcus]NTX08834.1 cell wall protein [Myxococcus sp. CA040A]NTX40754.1 cell wall protein [Myxococcus sp. CA033]NTX56566.1 cell wall protein [Myxococcus sp. CA039A]NTX63450.1 cell wall protein [Myxococcus sp. CA051A]TQF10273.1 cell wall protein [Myxococcus llanfairpwllgwyngyllgogerychwyrndrobwllllantysiliogogogochensis]